MYLSFYHLNGNCYEFYANSLDFDQRPQKAASELSLHCLLMSLLQDAMH